MIKYLKIDVKPKYWSDTSINGRDDISESEQRKRRKPRMPLAYFAKTESNNDNYRLSMTVDLENGTIINWPEITANMFYEIEEPGNYELLDEDNNIIASYVGEVPMLLNTTGESMGEWIELGDIFNDGRIKYWHNENRLHVYIEDFLNKSFGNE